MTLKALLIAAVLALALTGVAQAMTYDEADLWGRGVARLDCYAGPAPWVCQGFPYDSVTYHCAPQRWCVEFGYDQWNGVQTRGCVTVTHWLVDGIGLTYRKQICDPV